ncbi:MAG: DUF4912 domain-containing protein [Candidatus Omnitrophica bacterium]|nr:DUF4912 domain-containing protein [Candidatus Omnitrophota bacterium]
MAAPSQPRGGPGTPPRREALALDVSAQAPSASTPAGESQRQGPSSATAVEEQFSIPTGYGDDRIVLMVKDPWWLFAYWDIHPNTERTARRQLLPHEVAGLHSILRVYDVTGIDFPAQPAHASCDISLSDLATNWYIHVDAPNRSFIVEIGLLANGGRFLPLARSNRVTTPRFGPSDVIDEAWMTTDEAYWKLAGTLGLGSGSSPLGWSALLGQALSSGGWSSVSVLGQGRPSLVRGFWCRVDADLVIHGSTEPRAAVTIQGQPVTVRKDGTFSLRVALPDGTQTITIDATSPDGRHVRTVTPIVTLAWSGSLTSTAHRSPRTTGRRMAPKPESGGAS